MKLCVLALIFSNKADLRSLRFRRRGHALTNGGYELADYFIVAADLAFESIQFVAEFLVGQRELSQLDERSYHKDADLHRQW